MSEENEGGFKVTDRRLFKPDGSLRDDVLIEEEPVATSEPTQPPAIPAPAAAHSAPAQAAAPGPSTEEDAALPEQTMFTEFLMSVASSAFIYLGMMEHPATGRRHVDLNAAKESIDMLSMLRDKTRGNLTPGEESFFDELLSDLRMQFVSLRR